MSSRSAGSTAATVESFQPSVTCYDTSGRSQAAQRSPTVRIAEQNLHEQRREMDIWSTANANGELRMIPVDRREVRVGIAGFQRTAGSLDHENMLGARRKVGEVHPDCIAMAKRISERLGKGDFWSY